MSKDRGLSVEQIARDVLATKQEFSERHFREVPVGQVTDGLATTRVWGAARRVESKLTPTLSVRIYVVQKLPKALIPKWARLPAVLAGVPTDVIESPPAFLAVSPPCSLKKTRKQRPLCPGISAAGESVNAGTIAALCRSTRAGEDATRLILGNNHVFADLGAAAVGSGILQPSPRGGGSSADRVASLSRYVPIDESDSASNLVDAAVAELATDADAQSDICSLGAPAGVGEAAL